jgi:hypothetical protein
MFQNFSVRPQIKVVAKQNNESLVCIAGMHFIVSHVSKGDWRAFPVKSFPYVGRVSKKHYPFLKGDISLANASSWVEMRSKMLDKNSCFLLH